MCYGHYTCNIVLFLYKLEDNSESSHSKNDCEREGWRLFILNTVSLNNYLELCME